MSINWKQYWRECVEFMAVEHGFHLQVIAEYHLRITNNHGKSLDFFPKSKKATWVGTNQWMVIPDIEQFILKTFLDYGKV